MSKVFVFDSKIKNLTFYKGNYCANIRDVIYMYDFNLKRLIGCEVYYYHGINLLHFIAVLRAGERSLPLSAFLEGTMQLLVFETIFRSSIRRLARGKQFDIFVSHFQQQLWRKKKQMGLCL